MHQVERIKKGKDGEKKKKNKTIIVEKPNGEKKKLREARIKRKNSKGISYIRGTDSRRGPTHISGIIVE